MDFDSSAIDVGRASQRRAVTKRFHPIWPWVKTYDAIFGWLFTSIYHLFWCSLGARVLTHCHIGLESRKSRATSQSITRPPASFLARVFLWPRPWRTWSPYCCNQNHHYPRLTFPATVCPLPLCRKLIAVSCYVPCR